MTVRHRMYRYTVEGAGTFPYDMLRYDGSYPDQQADSLGLDLQACIQPRDRRTVTLIHQYIGPGGWEPCADRWKSFLWTVTESSEVT